MDKLDISLTYESATFVGCDGAGNMVFRPKSMSVSQWLRFWESVQTMDVINQSKTREELREAREEIKELEREIERLEEKIIKLEDAS